MRIVEFYKNANGNKRIRIVTTPPAGSRKINSRCYDSTHGAPAAVKPTEKTPVVLAGTSAVGDTLTATPATWNGSPAPTVVRVWKADTTVIAGETGLTYVIKAGDSGKTISVTETATNAAGSAVSNSNTVPVA